MNTENLNTKNIWEFTSDDTIYIPVKEKSTGNSTYYLCKFDTLVRNTVYGTILQIYSDKSWQGVKVGDKIYADFKRCALYGKSENEIYAKYKHFNNAGYAYKELEKEITDKTMSHPSFGMIGFSRVSRNLTPLFGSNIQHQNTITLKIHTAELNRHLNNDWFHAKRNLIEIELSGSQYAELITSMNMGDGVPCTIREFNGQSYPDPPYENPIDIFQREFEAKIKNLGKEVKSVVEDSLKMLKEKQTINKSDREFISQSIQRLIQEISSNIPFVSQQFNESMEKTVSQAKTEIETFVTNRITSLGIDAAKNNQNDLLSGLKESQTNLEQ